MRHRLTTDLRRDFVSDLGPGLIQTKVGVDTHLVSLKGRAKVVLFCLSRHGEGVILSPQAKNLVSQESSHFIVGMPQVRCSA